VILVSFLLIGCTAALPASEVESGARKVITFDGGEVTEGEVREAVERSNTILAAQTGGSAPEIEPGSPQFEAAKRQVVPQLLILNLSEAYARENGIRVSESEVQEEVDQAKEELARQAEAIGRGGVPEELFQEALDQLGYTESSFRQEARRSVLVRKVQEDALGDIGPTQEEIEDFYEENRSTLFTIPEQRCIRHILFSPDEEEEAEQVKDQLENGGDFGELARENSQDPGSRENGGGLGCRPRGSGFVPEFDEAAFEAREGDTVGPIETAFGLHLIEITEVRPEKEETLEEATPEIEDRLSQQRQAEAFREWAQEQLEERNVKYLPEYDPARPTPSGLSKGGVPKGDFPEGDVPKEEASKKDAPKVESKE
jgi:peptidyl-prolyl cis-trans isomerase C